MRASFGASHNLAARSLELRGGVWSILILAEALAGTTRFDRFQKRLGISPATLARRLNGLVDAGLLARRRYYQHPPRDEYVLTPRGRDFGAVIQALLDWAARHLAPAR